MSGWNSFLEVEPLTGRRHVEASERRTRQDWARWIRSMLTERYPQAERDGARAGQSQHPRNQVAVSQLPARASPGIGRAARNPLHARARQPARHRRDRVERPGRQCLNRWMPNLAAVRHQMRAWEQHRNNREVTVDWQFTTRDARIKLKTLYPKI